MTAGPATHPVWRPSFPSQHHGSRDPACSRVCTIHKGTTGTTSPFGQAAGIRPRGCLLDALTWHSGQMPTTACMPGSRGNLGRKQHGILNDQALAKGLPQGLQRRQVLCHRWRARPLRPLRRQLCGRVPSPLDLHGGFPLPSPLVHGGLLVRLCRGWPGGQRVSLGRHQADQEAASLRQRPGKVVCRLGIQRQEIALKGQLVQAAAACSSRRGGQRVGGGPGSLGIPGVSLRTQHGIPLQTAARRTPLPRLPLPGTRCLTCCTRPGRLGAPQPGRC